MIGCISINAVYTAKHGTFERLCCQLSVVAVELVLNLGAKVSILGSADCYTSLSTLPLRSANVSLRTYSGTPIPCLGRVFVEVRFCNRKLIRFRSTSLTRSFNHTYKLQS